jgi:ubiquinone/menaquinone biosynthesis C-methylase UbiE
MTTPLGGKLLLELGVGAGRHISHFAGFECIILLDFSRKQLEQGQQRLGASDRYGYVTADGYRLSFMDELCEVASEHNF